MAGNNSIQFLRGTSSQRASCTETSLAGQPVYETDTNRLYVGDGETSVNDLTAVKSSAADITDNVKEQNKGAGIKIWIGTQAEFEDLEADEDTIYYITDIVSVLELDEALKALKEQLTSGAFKVGKAGEADNVKSQINGNDIADIFEIDGTTAKEATHANSATNVTGQINGKAITSIFESNGTTAKEATHATAADRATNVTTNINGKAITSIFESDGTTVKNATNAAVTKGIQLKKLWEGSLPDGGFRTLSDTMSGNKQYIFEFGDARVIAVAEQTSANELTFNLQWTSYLQSDGFEISFKRLVYSSISKRISSDYGHIFSVVGDNSPSVRLGSAYLTAVYEAAEYINF